jgi:hypothetical protein
VIGHTTLEDPGWWLRIAHFHADCAALLAFCLLELRCCRWEQLGDNAVHERAVSPQTAKFAALLHSQLKSGGRIMTGPSNRLRNGLQRLQPTWLLFRSLA